jgi:hypothetical protein
MRRKNRDIALMRRVHVLHTIRWFLFGAKFPISSKLERHLTAWFYELPHP